MSQTGVGRLKSGTTEMDYVAVHEKASLCAVLLLSPAHAFAHTVQFTTSCTPSTGGHDVTDRVSHIFDSPRPQAQRLNGCWMQTLAGGEPPPRSRNC